MAFSGPPAHLMVGADRESTLRGTTILLWLLSALLVTGALMLGEELLDDGWIPLLVAGVAAGVGGWRLHRRAHGGRDERRAALLTELQPPVLRLAAEWGGRLTVTQAAAELGWTLRRTERVLASLDDGFRVSSEVTDEGVIVYEFRELIHLP